MLSIRQIRTLYATLALLAVGLFYTFYTLPPSGVLEVTVLDVGQGDAIFIRTPAGQRILIDAGPDSSILSALADRLHYFERRIDLLILTHPDADHIAGASDLLRRYEIGAVGLTGVLHDTGAYGDVLRQIRTQGIPVYPLTAATDLALGSDTTLDLLWPTENLIGQDVPDNNTTSIVAKLTYGETSFLFTGDANLGVEAALLGSGENLAADVLKLGHHGSRTSSGEEFLRAVQPSYALISAGAENRYGHPHPEVLERLPASTTQLFTTAGNLTLISDGHTLTKVD
jgi:competence protein ComEC